MIQGDTSKERHAIPRWNSPKTSMALGEMDSCLNSTSQSITINGTSELNKLLSEWKIGKSLPLAIEIISTAKIEQSDIDVSNIVQYVKDLSVSGYKLPFLVQELISETPSTGNDSTKQYAQYTNSIRKSLVEFPHNPLLWCELARMHVILGNIEKSENEIKVALSLAPNDRTVIRSAARYYIHIGNLDRAKYILESCPNLIHDPWILASEIALINEMGIAPRFIKQARGLLQSQNYSPLSLSELASELSTMDFKAGDSKNGKKKLVEVQKNPHENAFAQMVWINEHLYNIDSLLLSTSTPPHSFEAASKYFYSSGDWTRSLKATGLWLEYQPFSREPPLLASFIAADLLGDYEKSKEAILSGMKSNPNDEAIVNNYIYVLTLLGDYDTAKQQMSRAEMLFNINGDVSLTATRGLLFYRTGETELGHEQYYHAMEIASEQKDERLHCRAAIYLAREEQRVGHDITQLLSIINKSAQKPFFDELRPLLDSFNLNREI